MKAEKLYAALSEFVYQEASDMFQSGSLRTRVTDSQCREKMGALSQRERTISPFLCLFSVLVQQ